MGKQCILDNFRVKSYLRCSCTLSTLRASLALFLKFISNSIVFSRSILDNFRVKSCLLFVAVLFSFQAKAGCQQRRIKSLCEAPGTPCVWGNNRCSLRRLIPEGEKDENPSVLENFHWRPLNEHQWPKD